MNIYITLDYELFFGSTSGTSYNSIIKPTKKLLEIVNPYNIKLVFFVDVGYLIKLKEYKKEYPQLEEDFSTVSTQIQDLAKNGHGIELHIHPHWEDTIYDGEKWVFNTSRYKLSDFSEEEATAIINKYSRFLKSISGVAPVAYRAGGWSAQPFTYIKKGLQENNIKIDSTVYPKGFYNSKNQVFDFRKIPLYKTKYQFETDLTVEDTNGYFTEIPISSYKLSPIFFWKFIIEKLKKSPEHKAYGDGYAISKSKKEVFRLLLKSSYSVASIDGYKASFLDKAFKKYCKNTTKEDNFVIIGHPKAFTPFSLQQTKIFIETHYKEHSFLTF